MQAFEAYYSNGNFVPFGIGFIPEGAKAIVTVLNEFPCNMQEQLRGFDALVSEIHAAADEDMPEILPIKLREVEI
jgi:hypothetical protein